MGKNREMKFERFGVSTVPKPKKCSIVLAEEMATTSPSNVLPDANHCKMSKPGHALLLDKDIVYERIKSSC
jgi:hypothetical protein